MTRKPTVIREHRRFSTRLLLACGAALLLGGGVPAARADVVTTWNKAATELLPKMGKQGNFYLRGLAMMHAAMFDAVNSIEHEYAPLKVDTAATAGASSEAAAAAAARRVLLELVPQQREAIEAVFMKTVAGIPDGDGKTRGAALGEDVAVKIALWRATDRSDQLVVYAPPVGAGFYLPTSGEPMVAPHWGKVAPWTMTRGDQFRPEPPPRLDSPAWQRDLAETTAFGGMVSTSRTEAQTAIARFHAPPDFPMWNEIAREIVDERHLSLGASTRVFAMLNIAMADTHIAVYDAKFAYNFWRPVTAVHAGSPGGAANAEWQSLIPAPMHPEYPCGHCALGAAAEVVMTAEFGHNAAFTVTMPGPAGVTRAYTSFAAFAEEEAYSRIVGGIHFRSSMVAGDDLAHKVVEQLLSKAMRPQS